MLKEDASSLKQPNQSATPSPAIQPPKSIMKTSINQKVGIDKIKSIEKELGFEI